MRQQYQSLPADQQLDASQLKELPVLDRFLLNTDDASYTLSLELETSIEMVILQVQHRFNNA